MMRSRIHSRGVAGFTLVELLVVVAVIGLLIAVLLPALSTARGAARSAACLSNLRQIAQATTVYANDHGGYSPALGVPWGRPPFWALVVQAYAGRDTGGTGDRYSERSVLVSPAAVARYGPGLTRTYAVNVTGHAGSPGDRSDYDTELAHVRLFLVREASTTPGWVTSAVAQIAGGGPPPTRAASTLDFRDGAHVSDRLGRYVRGRSGVAFNAGFFDGSAGTRDAVGAAWSDRLP